MRGDGPQQSSQGFEYNPRAQRFISELSARCAGARKEIAEAAEFLKANPRYKPTIPRTSNLKEWENAWLDLKAEMERVGRETQRRKEALTRVAR